VVLAEPWVSSGGESASVCFGTCLCLPTFLGFLLFFFTECASVFCGSSPSSSPVRHGSTSPHQGA
jgi:hypothetical protein